MASSRLSLRGTSAIHRFLQGSKVGADPPQTVETESSECHSCVCWHQKPRRRCSTICLLRPKPLREFWRFQWNISRTDFCKVRNTQRRWEILLCTLGIVTVTTSVYGWHKMTRRAHNGVTSLRDTAVYPQLCGIVSITVERTDVCPCTYIYLVSCGRWRAEHSPTSYCSHILHNHCEVCP